jgi:hypothetical protein
MNIIICICSVFAMFLQGFCNVDTIHEYPETFIVVAVDPEHDFITLQDFNGFTWSWNSAEDWQEGDIAIAIMDSNGTVEIQDDIILELKYSGYIAE